MMRKRPAKQALRAAFAAPPPAGKRAFVRSLPRPHPGMAALIWQQLRWLTESGRSARCGMAELEMAAAFPLHSILLARMALLSAVHAMLLAALTAAARAVPLPNAGVPVRLPWPRALAFVLAPYLLTAVLGLALCRRMGGDAAWPCFGAALAVSTAGLMLPQMGMSAALSRALPWALPPLLAVLVWQLRAALKQTEELPCS